MRKWIRLSISIYRKFLWQWNISCSYFQIRLIVFIISTKHKFLHRILALFYLLNVQVIPFSDSVFILQSITWIRLFLPHGENGWIDSASKSGQNRHILLRFNQFTMKLFLSFVEWPRGDQVSVNWFLNSIE